MSNGILILIMVLGAGIASGIALSKNRNVVGWFLFGAFMPLIAVVAVSCLAPVPEPSYGHNG